MISPEKYQKLISRFEESFGCKYHTSVETNDSLTLEFSLLKELDYIHLGLCIYKEGFDIKVRMEQPNVVKIVKTINWEEYEKSAQNTDLILSEISLQIIGFIALWVKEAESIKVMDWIKLHGRSQTLLEKIQKVSEKNL